MMNTVMSGLNKLFKPKLDHLKQQIEHAFEWLGEWAGSLIDKWLHPHHPEPVPHYPAESTYTPNPGTTEGSSDASAAVALDDKYMIVGDDEGNVLRVYDRDGGHAVVEWNYSQAIGIDGEVDLEGAVKVGDMLFLTGSHSNKKDGSDADAREVIFAVKVSGTGADTQFSYQGKFTGMESALVAWDAGNQHGKGANYFGFAESSGAGIAPENTNGFSIEGLTTSMDNRQLWLGFRAPQTDTGTRDKALIVSVDNYQALLSGHAEAPHFGQAIELNLGGRGIRSIDKASDGSGYLIVAGPSGPASADVAHNFRLYTWDGQAAHAPVELNNDLDALLAATGGSFESIVSPASILPGSKIQLLQDNGDTLWPGQSEVSKDLDPALQQFKGNLVTLGSAVVDHQAPMLVRASPADEAQGVAPGSKLVFAFDEGVAMGAGTLELRDGDGKLVQAFAGGGAGVKVDFNTITLQPSEALNPSSQYHLVFNDNAVTDHYGNALARDTLDFTTGAAPHHDVLITEVNSNATGGDFFELYNYGTATLDLGGWRMNDEEANFGSGVALPSGLTLEAGKSLVVASIDPGTLNDFKAAWGLDDSVQVVAIDGPGLGKQDAVVLFDGQGNVATAFNYDADSIVASDGSVIATSLAAGAFTDNQHAGAAYGAGAKASAVWDGVSFTDPHYLGATPGNLGAHGQAGDAASIGSPGVVEIVQTGVPVALEHHGA